MTKIAIKQKYFFQCLKYEVEVLEHTLLAGFYEALKEANPDEWSVEYLIDNAGKIATYERLLWIEGRKSKPDEFACVTYELAQKGAFSEILRYVFEDVKRDEAEAFFRFVKNFAYFKEVYK